MDLIHLAVEPELAEPEPQPLSIMHSAATLLLGALLLPEAPAAPAAQPAGQPGAGGGENCAPSPPNMD